MANEYITSTARELVQAWVAQNVAHGGAVDFVEVANGSIDADGYADLAMNFNPKTANDQALQDFVSECDENRFAVRAEFVRFVDECVERAEEIEAAA